VTISETQAKKLKSVHCTVYFAHIFLKYFTNFVKYLRNFFSDLFLDQLNIFIEMYQVAIYIEKGMELVSQYWGMIATINCTCL